MSLEGDVTGNWRAFKESWRFYSIATGLDEAMTDTQGVVNVRGRTRAAAALLTVMGEDCLSVVNSLPNIAEADKADPAVILARLEEHFVPQRHVLFERYKFNSADQEAGESIDAYVLRLRQLSASCEFEALHDSLLRDRLVMGTRDGATRDRLLRERPVPDLPRCVQSLQASEVSHAHQSQMGGSKAAAVNIDAFTAQKSRKPGKGPHWHRGSQQQPVTGKQCKWCGKEPHPIDKCRARDAICLNCRRRGHFKAVCRSAASSHGSKVHGVKATASPSSASASASATEPKSKAFMGDVHLNEVNNDSDWTAVVSVNGSPIKFKLDSGAQVTVIGEESSCLRDVALQEADQTLHGPGNISIPTLGMVSMTLSRKDKTCRERLYIVPGQSTPLLSRRACSELGLLSLTVGAVSEAKPYKEDFPELFQGLGKLDEPYAIKLRPDAQPVCLYAPRRVPQPLMETVKEQLDDMVESGVISPVRDPTEWCSGLVLVPKANRKSWRICVDLTKLNEAVQREVHPMASVDDSLAQLSGSRYFTKLDANSGFWQIPLDESSKLLTTFITPFGRYAFNRLPFGISSAPEIYQRMMSDILKGVSNVVCHMDDLLVHGRTADECDRATRKVMQCLRDAGLTLNEEKCEFAKTSITFLGHVVDGSGLRPDPRKVKAVSEFPEPTDLTSLRRFLGMAEQMGKFIPALSSLTCPLRELLRKDTDWVWDQTQQQAFDRVKALLTSTDTLAHYDPHHATVIAADASTLGRGAVLYQTQPDGIRRPVYYASRSLTSAERNYAVIELEALAMTWAAERFSDYVLGTTFTIETDHKPLVPLMTVADLAKVPARIQRFRLRMMRFSPKICYVPGKQQVTADALSRAPVEEPVAADVLLVEEANSLADHGVENLPATSRKLKEISVAQQADEECQQVVQFVKHGWPAYMPQLPLLRPYWESRGHFSMVGELLLYDDRVVIPRALRLEMLGKLHEGHLGIVKCRARARESMWFPSISQSIQDLVANCHTCAKVRPTPTEPLMPSSFPSRPWERVATDLFTHDGQSYVLVVDYFSRWIEVRPLDGQTSSDIIHRLKSIFATHGIPDIVMSDNGPQYSSEQFLNFAQSYEFTHVTSSPRYPQANGEAERAVRTIKDLLKKKGDPYLALLAYRTAPLQNGFSPAELLMGRQLNSRLPVLPSQLEPGKKDTSALVNREEEYREAQRVTYDRRHKAKDLPALSPNDPVWIRDLERYGHVIGRTSGPRSYQISSGNHTVRRNRSALVAVPDEDHADPDDSPVDSAAEPQQSPKQPAATPTLSPPRLEAAEPRRTRYGRVIRTPERLNL